MNRQYVMKDYVEWRGSLSFDRDWFNVADNLVVAQLSYVDFSAADLSKPVLLREAGKDILRKKAYRLKNLFGGEEELFRDIIAAHRFGKMILSGYEEIFDENNDVQFSALTLRISETMTCIAFRGTDDSLTGWKEDFMINFTVTKSQRLAAEYLSSHILDDQEYIIIGHSKGGNLALYSAMMLDDEKLAKVRKIYADDAPGFSPEIVDLSKLDRIRDKVTCVLPEFCLIGRIYDMHFEDTRIVKTTIYGPNCHDMVTWRIDGGDLVYARETDPVSDYMITTVMNWAAEASVEEKETFVNEVFRALGAGGAKKIQDIPRRKLTNVLSALAMSSGVVKNLLVRLMKKSVNFDVGINRPGRRYSNPKKDAYLEPKVKGRIWW